MADNLQYLCGQLLADYLSTNVAEVAIPTPDAPLLTQTGTLGTSTVGYRLVVVARGGHVGPASTEALITTAPATLSSTRYVTVSWPRVQDAGGYLLYRTTGTNPGLIARLAPGDDLVVKDMGVRLSADMPAAAYGRVSVTQEDPDAVQDYPAIMIVPRQFSFEPTMGSEVQEDTSDTTGVTLDIGTWTGQIELRIASPDKVSRRGIQARVVDLMFAAGKPWLQLNTEPLTLGTTATLVSAPIVYELSETTWQEEVVFEKKRYSFLTVTVRFSALVHVDNVYNIESLLVTLEHRMQEEYVPNVAVTLSVDETTGDVTIVGNPTYTEDKYGNITVP